MFSQRIVAVFACFALASCGLPRGAGFQSEVLAASNANTAAAGEEPVYDFSVYDVNRATLPVLQGWPVSGVENFPWITAQEQPASLMIAPGDTVQLTIWDAEENSLLAGAGQRVTPLQEAAVNVEGRIFVPYIGELRVAGMSPSTARTRIEEELIRTIPSAQVQLVVEPGRENTANLAAGVTAPGLYQLPDRNFKILDLFSLAGGPDPTMNVPQVRLIRDGKTFGIPFQRLLEEPRLNTAMRGGDRIFALIGGVNAGTANPEAILILRDYDLAAVSDGIAGPPKERVVFTIDLTSADGLFSAGQFMLEDNDLIYGTESALGPALTLFGLTNSLVGASQ